MNNHQSLSMNQNSRKTRFAFRFVRALARIRMSTTTQQPQQRSSTSTTSRRIKLAADASMASTVGSRRVWSRAILLKLRRSQTKRRAFLISKKKNHMMMKNKKNKVAAAAIEEDKVQPMMSTRANKLRRLVPGGEDMDFCSLLEETAHYIKCLNTQVQVMKSIADIYTS